MIHLKPWSHTVIVIIITTTAKTIILNIANKTLQKDMMSLLYLNFIVYYTLVTTYIHGPVGQMSHFFSSDTLLFLSYNLATNLAVLRYLKSSIPRQ